MVSIRSAAPEDAPHLLALLDAVGAFTAGAFTAGAFTAGGLPPDQIASEALFGSSGVRIAEDGHRVVGAAQLHVRNAGPPSPGELVFLAAPEPGVGLLLMADLLRRAAAGGVEFVHVVVRPPFDAPFRILGAVAIEIEPSCDGLTGPLIRLEMTLERLPQAQPDGYETDCMTISNRASLPQAVRRA